MNCWKSSLKKSPLTGTYGGAFASCASLFATVKPEVGVLPVVFTFAQTTESEIQKEVEHNVSLIGREGLNTLLAVLEVGKNRGEILDFLRTMRPANSVAVYKVGFMPRR